jgi:hypothetical protein
MSVTAVSSTPAYTTPATSAVARTADGDYKTANALSSQIKDSNGDYKPLTSSAAQNSASVQTALASLKKGG